METVGGEVTDHGLALYVDDVPWADRQIWATDANRKGDSYYFYFPAKNENGVLITGLLHPIRQVVRLIHIPSRLKETTTWTRPCTMTQRLNFTCICWNLWRSTTAIGNG